MNVNEFIDYPCEDIAENEVFSIRKTLSPLNISGMFGEIACSFFLKELKNGQDGHLGFRIAPKSNNTSSENLVEHLWEV